MTEHAVPLVAPHAGRPYLRYSNQARAQWLIPVQRHARRCAAQMYTPIRLGGHVRKQLMRRGLAGESVWVSEAWLEQLAEVLEPFVESEHVHLVLFIASPGALSKTAILVANDSGEAVAFAKLATSEHASQALRTEHAWLRRLYDVPVLRPSVPHPLGLMRAHNATVLVTSVAPVRPGSARFGAPHLHLLGDIAQSFGGTEVYEATAEYQRLLHMSVSLDGCSDARTWRDRLERAAVRLSSDLGGRRHSIGLAHGDFTPWNTRRSRDGLFVFDWESATPNSLPNHDFFHFHFMSELLLRNGASPRTISTWLRTAPYQNDSTCAYLLAYLVDVSLRYHDLHRVEGRRDDDAVLRQAGVLLDAAERWCD